MNPSLPKGKNMRNALTNSLKVAVTGFIVCTVGWGILTFSGDPAEPISKKAEADIFGFDFAPKSKHAKVVDTLLDDGFEPPRTYDWNGNKFFFTLKHQNKEPMEVMRDLQGLLKQNGVNKHAHMFMPTQLDMGILTNPDKFKNLPKAEQEKFVKATMEHKARLDDFFAGGIVPFHMEKDYMNMAGTVLKDPPKDSLGVVTKMLKHKGNFQNQIERLYHVESFRRPNSNNSTTTAMWSQKNVDFDKFDPKKGKIDNVNHNIPSCVGCELITSFRGQDNEDKYANNIFSAKHTSPAQAHSFYKSSLERRGWKRAETTDFLYKAQRDGLMPQFGAMVESYARGKDFITVIAHPSDLDGSTTVQLMESP